MELKQQEKLKNNMRNNDTIFLEQAYQKIFEKKSFRKIISEEADNLTEFVKSRKEDIKNITDLYAKAKDGNVEDLEKANAALTKFNQELGKLSPTPAAASAPAAPTPQVAPAATPATPQTQITAPNVQSAEEKAKSMMDANGNSPVVSTPKQPVAPTPQPTPASVAPQPVTPTPAQQASPVQPQSPAVTTFNNKNTNKNVPTTTQAQPQSPAVTTFNNKNVPTTTQAQPQFKANPQLAQNPAQVASSNPSQQELAKFQKETGTPFNPKSVNDKLNLSLMRKGKSTLNSQQANSYRKANPNWTPDTV